MDNQRTKMLGENLTHYRNLQENGSVNLIEFHTTDNRKFGIGNPDAIKLLLSAAVTELERQLHIAQSGGLPERLEQSREYKAAKALEALHVEEIEVLGKPFDPNFMNAVQQVPAEDGQESGTVVRVFQKGYMIGDKIIRHATVVVAE